MVYLIYFFQSFARSHQPCAVNIAGGLECEQSLFFFRFREENARGERRARQKKRGRRPEKIKESLSFFMPLPSRAFSHARFVRRTKKKERLLEIYQGYIPGLFII